MPYKFELKEVVDFKYLNRKFSNGVIDRRRHTSTDDEPQYLILYNNDFYSITESDITERPAKTYTIKELRAAVEVFYRTTTRTAEAVRDFLETLEANE